MAEAAHHRNITTSNTKKLIPKDSRQLELIEWLVANQTKKIQPTGDSQREKLAQKQKWDSS